MKERGFSLRSFFFIDDLTQKILIQKSPNLFSQRESNNFCFKLLFFFAPLFLYVHSYAQSALQKGTWVQVSVEESGVYKISYQDLQSWGFTDISSVAVFGNGAGELNLLNSSELPDTLHEIGIFLHQTNADTFSDGDYLLFYGQSPDTWTYNSETKNFTHNTHTYCRKNYYYITTSRKATKTIQTKTTTNKSYTQTITSYDYLDAYEKNETSILNTGRNLFETISGTKTISFSIPDIITTEQAKTTVAVAARHASSNTVTISANEEIIGNQSFAATTSNKPYAYLKENLYTFLPKSNNINIQITPNYSAASSRCYLDFCTIQARCSLKTNSNNPIIFRDSKSIEKDGVGKFVISSASNCSVWNITNPKMPIALETEYSNNSTIFYHATDTLEEFVAFSEKYKSVDFIKTIDNQDIISNKNFDMIIITTDMYVDYAQKLADLHQKIDNFSVGIINQEAICNEFSAGRNDVGAIRNYLRYIYKTGNQKLKYVLLLGDGTYRNDIELNGNQLFTFETKESLNEDYSLCSDDFFAILGDNDGVNGDTFVGNNSIAIGRLPVNSKKEADILVDKIIQYATNPEYRGDWQNYLCFLADDADENQTMHMSDANSICTQIETLNPNFNFDKIFADAYKQELNSAGERYPDVVTAIFERMQKGCLVFNYSGHGNETRMMQEYAVDATTIKTWKNETRLPLFVAAACNIGHFDYDGVSIGEKLLLEKNGGGIGIVSASRYSYATSNYILSKYFYDALFTPDSLQQNQTIGEALRIAKVNITNELYQNKRIYNILGDPALRLNIPTYSIELDSINGKSATTFNDTIKATSVLHIVGHIANNGEKIPTYNGELSIKLFDKEQNITTLGNDGNDTYTFSTYTNILFQGKASITNGTFSFETIIPEDIYYYDGTGKLSLYANNDTTQAAGAYYNIFINGSETNSYIDETGPKITAYIQDTTFQNGKTVNEQPTLYLILQDTSGINISNASIGHDISLILDDDESNQIILNDFYYADLNTYISGSLAYQLSGLDEGTHTLKIIVWDNFNNSSETEISFIVANSESIHLQNIFNYPNPMTEVTTFHFEHNQAGNEITITIRIYDSQGNKVKTIRAEGTPEGLTETALTWDGTRDNGSAVSNGIYPYTIEITNENGDKLFGEQKILLIK